MTFLATGSAGVAVTTSDDFDYTVSRDGGSENTMREGIVSGAGAYAGPNTNYTRPLSEPYAQQQTAFPIYGVAPDPLPQQPNAYTDTGNAQINIMDSSSTTAPINDCGCSGSGVPWFVLVLLVAGVLYLTSRS